jgi:oxidase EvaA
VIGVSVTAGSREVDRWMQPMLRPRRTGLIAFLVCRRGGVLHALAHARVEAGCADVVELAPTVQCTPANYAHLPVHARPAFIDDVLGAEPRHVRLDATLVEDGGRFYHCRNRYLVVEVDSAHRYRHPDFRWVTVHQLGELLRHSHYLNVQARTLVAALRGMCGGY